MEPSWTIPSLSLLPAYTGPPAVCSTLRTPPLWPVPTTALCPRSATLPRATVREACCLSTPGVLGSGPSSVVSVHHGLLRPHPPVSRAHRDFTALRLIHDAFAVRERLGCPRDLPYFHCRAVHACRRPYAGGSAPPSRFFSARRYQASSTYQRVATHKTRLCQQSSTGLNVSTPHRSLYATARAFAKPSRLATTR